MCIFDTFKSFFVYKVLVEYDSGGFSFSVFSFFLFGKRFFRNGSRA